MLGALAHPTVGARAAKRGAMLVTALQGVAAPLPAALARELPAALPAALPAEVLAPPRQLAAPSGRRPDSKRLKERRTSWTLRAGGAVRCAREALLCTHALLCCLGKCRPHHSGSAGSASQALWGVGAALSTACCCLHAHWGAAKGLAPRGRPGPGARCAAADGTPASGAPTGCRTGCSHSARRTAPSAAPPGVTSSAAASPPSHSACAGGGRGARALGAANDERIRAAHRELDMHALPPLASPSATRAPAPRRFRHWPGSSAAQRRRHCGHGRPAAPELGGRGAGVRRGEAQRARPAESERRSAGRQRWYAQARVRWVQCMLGT